MTGTFSKSVFPLLLSMSGRAKEKEWTVKCHGFPAFLTPLSPVWHWAHLYMQKAGDTQKHIEKPVYR